MRKHIGCLNDEAIRALAFATVVSHLKKIGFISKEKTTPYEVCEAIYRQLGWNLPSIKRHCNRIIIRYLMQVIPHESRKIVKTLTILPEIRTVSAPKQDSFYATVEWRRLRYRVFKERGAKCELCQQTDGPLHVDHIKPRSRFPELALNEDNLQILCEECNLGKGTWDQTDWRQESKNKEARE
jgi:5-methylcytosine-specific restriction endonuclease McrA